MVSCLVVSRVYPHGRVVGRETLYKYIYSVCLYTVCLHYNVVDCLVAGRDMFL